MYYCFKILLHSFPSTRKHRKTLDTGGKNRYNDTTSLP